MGTKGLSVFGEEAIRRKIRRMAWEVIEKNFKERTLDIVGVNQRGFTLAGALCKELSMAGHLSLSLFNARIGEEVGWRNAKGQRTTKQELFGGRDGVNILLVDDVANTGETILRGVAEVVPFLPQKIEIAVLVERSHKRYPFTANYKGCELSTTLNDHVLVCLDKEWGVYLQQGKD